MRISPRCILDLRIGNHKLGAVTGTKTPTKPKIMKAHKSAEPHAPDNAQYRALYAKR